MKMKLSQQDKSSQQTLTSLFINAKEISLTPWGRSSNENLYLESKSQKQQDPKAFASYKNKIQYQKNCNLNSNSTFDQANNSPKQLKLRTIKIGDQKQSEQNELPQLSRSFSPFVKIMKQNKKFQQKQFQTIQLIDKISTSTEPKQQYQPSKKQFSLEKLRAYNVKLHMQEKRRNNAQYQGDEMQCPVNTKLRNLSSTKLQQFFNNSKTRQFNKTTRLKDLYPVENTEEQELKKSILDSCKRSSNHRKLNYNSPKNNQYLLKTSFQNNSSSNNYNKPIFSKQQKFDLEINTIKSNQELIEKFLRNRNSKQINTSNNKNNNELKPIHQNSIMYQNLKMLVGEDFQCNQELLKSLQLKKIPQTNSKDLLVCKTIERFNTNNDGKNYVNKFQTFFGVNIFKNASQIIEKKI